MHHVVKQASTMVTFTIQKEKKNNNNKIYIYINLLQLIMPL